MEAPLMGQRRTLTRNIKPASVLIALASAAKYAHLYKNGPARHDGSPRPKKEKKQ
jgi:hypothetical protein